MGSSTLRLLCISLLGFPKAELRILQWGNSLEIPFSSFWSFPRGTMSLEADSLVNYFWRQRICSFIVRVCTHTHTPSSLNSPSPPHWHPTPRTEIPKGRRLFCFVFKNGEKITILLVSWPFIMPVRAFINVLSIAPEWRQPVSCPPSLVAVCKHWWLSARFNIIINI